MDYEEKTLDCLILGILRQDSNCDLTYISEKLKLPKTEIMKHIRYLCDNGYLALHNNQFSITSRGDSIAIHPDSVSHSDYLYPDTISVDWKNYSYIPTPKSFSAKKK